MKYLLVFIICVILGYTAERKTNPKLKTFGAWKRTKDNTVIGNLTTIFTRNGKNFCILGRVKNHPYDSLSFAFEEDICDKVVYAKVDDNPIVTIYSQKTKENHLLFDLNNHAVKRLVEQMQDGKVLTAEYSVGNNEQREVHFNLEGFTKGYKWLFK